eukprot:TRINITY_DN5415_c0_g1_i4.p1 TRINITY_DN5415_c0_g1~~TRINITY_DN5415_c0_g1_i4.p1  ORF type:complete len:365 (-),score=80.97 TRINITY_DN5415_c0_g1_i4:37-1131(-)
MDCNVILLPGIPPDLHPQVFSSIKPRDLLALSQVSKSFRNYFDSPLDFLEKQKALVANHKAAVLLLEVLRKQKGKVKRKMNDGLYHRTFLYTWDKDHRMDVDCTLDGFLVNFHLTWVFPGIKNDPMYFYRVLIELSSTNWCYIPMDISPYQFKSVNDSPEFADRSEEIENSYGDLALCRPMWDEYRAFKSKKPSWNRPVATYRNTRWIGVEHPLALRPTFLGSSVKELQKSLDSSFEITKKTNRFLFTHPKIGDGKMKLDTVVLFMVYHIFSSESFRILKDEYESTRSSMREKDPVIVVIGLSENLLKPSKSNKSIPVKEEEVQSFCKSIGSFWMQTNTMYHQSEEMKKLFKEIGTRLKSRENQ